MRAAGFLLGFVGLVVFQSARAAEPPAPSIRLQPTRVRLGEPFECLVTVPHAAAEKVELKLPLQWGPFELLKKTQQETSGASPSTTFRLRLSAFAVGTLALPELRVETIEASSQRSERLLSGPEIEVVASEPKGEKATELEDIKGPERLLVRTYRLLYGLGAVLLVLAVYLGWLRWRRGHPPEHPVGPTLSLEARTLQALDALANADLPGRGKVREFFFALSEIVRGYLGERYGFEALECTSTELLSVLRRLSPVDLPADALCQFVHRGDEVKFARGLATADDCKEALAFSYALIRATTPKPLPISPDHAGHSLS